MSSRVLTAAVSSIRAGRPSFRTCLRTSVSAPASAPVGLWKTRPFSQAIQPSNTDIDIDIDALGASMAARPPKAIYDVLSPMPSHLLNVSLSDYLPPECGAVQFADSSFSLPTASTTLPHGHHLVHFPLQKPPSLLLSDGTDPDQSPGPPFGRRMWAGGSVRFLHPERLVLDGRRAVCVERLGEISARGPSGAEKLFVDVWRRYDSSAEADTIHSVEANPAIEERRTLVFMRDSQLSPESFRLVKSPLSPDYSFSLTPSSTLLFHFSALTYNAHAIHLNPQYCQNIEGHRDLLFHGPLALVLMLSILRSRLPDPVAIKSIEYRNLAPLYAHEPLRVCIRQNHNAVSGNKWDIWIEGPHGGLAVRGTAVSTKSCSIFK